MNSYIIFKKKHFSSCCVLIRLNHQYLPVLHNHKNKTCCLFDRFVFVVVGFLSRCVGVDIRILHALIFAVFINDKTRAVRD